MARWNPFTRKEEAPLESSGDAPETPAGLLGRFKTALKKTVQVLNTDIRDLVGKEGRLVDDDFLDELFAYLIKTDMGNGPATKIRDEIARKFCARKVMMSDLVDSAKTTIHEIMHQENDDVCMADSGPTVVMVVGVNGSGKTTSIAKLAKRFIDSGNSVVLARGIRSGQQPLNNSRSGQSALERKLLPVARVAIRQALLTRPSSRPKTVTRMSVLSIPPVDFRRRPI